SASAAVLSKPTKPSCARTRRALPRSSASSTYSRTGRVPWRSRVRSAPASVSIAASVVPGRDALGHGVGCGCDGQHLLVGEDVLERVGQPVHGGPVAPGDEVEVLALEVEMHLA